MSKLEALQAALAVLPAGFRIMAPLPEMLAVSDEAGAATWKDLATHLKAEITSDGFTGLLTLTKSSES